MLVLCDQARGHHTIGSSHASDCACRLRQGISRSASCVAYYLARREARPYDEALALALLSKHTKSSVRESAQLSQEAQEIFTRLGVADPGL